MGFSIFFFVQIVDKKRKYKMNYIFQYIQIECVFSCAEGNEHIESFLYIAHSVYLNRTNHCYSFYCVEIFGRFFFYSNHSTVLPRVAWIYNIICDAHKVKSWHVFKLSLKLEHQYHSFCFLCCWLRQMVHERDKLTKFTKKTVGRVSTWVCYKRIYIHTYTE